MCLLLFCCSQQTTLAAPSALWAQTPTVPLLWGRCGPKCWYPLAPDTHTGLLVISDSSHPMAFFISIDFVHLVIFN